MTFEIFLSCLTSTMMEIAMPSAAILTVYFLAHEKCFRFFGPAINTVVSIVLFTPLFFLFSKGVFSKSSDLVDKILGVDAHSAAALDKLSSLDPDKATFLSSFIYIMHNISFTMLLNAVIILIGLAGVIYGVVGSLSVILKNVHTRRVPILALFVFLVALPVIFGFLSLTHLFHHTTSLPGRLPPSIHSTHSLPPALPAPHLPHLAPTTQNATSLPSAVTVHAKSSLTMLDTLYLFAQSHYVLMVGLLAALFTVSPCKRFVDRNNSLSCAVLFTVAVVILRPLSDIFYGKVTEHVTSVFVDGCSHIGGIRQFSDFFFVILLPLAAIIAFAAFLTFLTTTVFRSSTSFLLLNRADRVRDFMTTLLSFVSVCCFLFVLYAFAKPILFKNTSQSCTSHVSVHDKEAPVMPFSDDLPAPSPDSLPALLDAPAPVIQGATPEPSVVMPSVVNPKMVRPQPTFLREPPALSHAPTLTLSRKVTENSPNKTADFSKMSTDTIHGYKISARQIADGWIITYAIKALQDSPSETSERATILNGSTFMPFTSYSTTIADGETDYVRIIANDIDSLDDADSKGGDQAILEDMSSENGDQAISGQGETHVKQDSPKTPAQESKPATSDEGETPESSPSKPEEANSKEASHEPAPAPPIAPAASEERNPQPSSQPAGTQDKSTQDSDAVKHYLETHLLDQ